MAAGDLVTRGQLRSKQVAAACRRVASKLSRVSRRPDIERVRGGPASQRRAKQAVTLISVSLVIFIIRHLNCCLASERGAWCPRGARRGSGY